MLPQFFVFIIAIIIFLITALLFFKLVLPIYRFKVRYEALTTSYNRLLNFILLKNLFFEKTFTYTREYLFGYKYKISFNNTSELELQLEKLINEALEYYDKLGIIPIIFNNYKVMKNELLEMRSEIKKLRWRRQKN